MPAQSNYVLTDAASTPVDHTFSPKGVVNVNGKSVATWREQSIVDNAIGYYVLTETFTPSNANGVAKFRFVLDVPTLETPASGGAYEPPPKKAFSTVGAVEFFMHDRATKQNIKDVVAMLGDLVTTANFVDTVYKREPSWS